MRGAGTRARGGAREGLSARAPERSCLARPLRPFRKTWRAASRTMSTQSYGSRTAAAPSHLSSSTREARRRRSSARGGGRREAGAGAGAPTVAAARWRCTYSLRHPHTLAARRTPGPRALLADRDHCPLRQLQGESPAAPDRARRITMSFNLDEPANSRLFVVAGRNTSVSSRPPHCTHSAIGGHRPHLPPPLSRRPSSSAPSLSTTGPSRSSNT